MRILYLLLFLIYLSLVLGTPWMLVVGRLALGNVGINLSTGSLDVHVLALLVLAWLLEDLRHGLIETD